MADRDSPIYTIKRFRGQNEPNGAKKFFTQKDPRLREDDEKRRGDDEKCRGDDEKRRGDDEKRRGDDEKRRGDDKKTLACARVTRKGSPSSPN